MKWRRCNQLDFLALASVILRCRIMARPSFCTSSCTAFKNGAVTAFRPDVATQTAMGNKWCATSHVPRTCMVKPSTVMENCLSMDRKSSPRPPRAFRIRFDVDKQVKKLDPSSAMDSLKQYSESSSIRSSSSSMIHFQALPWY